MLQLLDALDYFNHLFPGTEKEDTEDMAWPGVWSQWSLYCVVFCSVIKMMMVMVVEMMIVMMMILVVVLRVMVVLMMINNSKL